MTEALKRSVLRYYVALQLSAGAVNPLAMPIADDGPPPIVRRYQHAQGLLFDPREVIKVGDETAIVTTPMVSKSGAGRESRYLN